MPGDLTQPKLKYARLHVCSCARVTAKLEHTSMSACAWPCTCQDHCECGCANVWVSACTCRCMNHREANVVAHACVQVGTRKPVIICDDRDHWLVVITNDNLASLSCREGGVHEAPVTMGPHMWTLGWPASHVEWDHRLSPQSRGELHLRAPSTVTPM